MAAPKVGGLLHIICSWHGGRGDPALPTGPVPHFVVDLSVHPLGFPWTYAGSLSFSGTEGHPTPGEPTPVYEGGQPGDGAYVKYFIARTSTGKRGDGALAIGLYKLDWIAPTVKS